MTAPRPKVAKTSKKVLAMRTPSIDAQVCTKQNETIRSIPKHLVKEQFEAFRSVLKQFAGLCRSLKGSMRQRRSFGWHWPVLSGT
jgi:hypothetical protein